MASTAAQQYAARRADLTPRGMPSTKTMQEVAFYQGWLKKRALGKSAGTLVKSWRTRYFVLLSGELRWYESAQVLLCFSPGRCATTK